MILISHRGNIEGPNPQFENHPTRIDGALSKGYDCEIDVRIIDNEIYLGHDNPTHLINIGWLHNRKNNLWIHCKDLETFSKFNTYYNKLNYFFHDSDLGVLTSLSYIWSANNVKNGILVMPELFDTKPNKYTLGVCSDYIKSYK
tara:strand:+ start:1183 stop:1614 length:432 start_codon:yes stop_codon:yes gene_type:complete